MSNWKHRCLIVSCLVEEGVIVALEQVTILVSTSGYLGLEFVIFSSEIRHGVITGRSQVPTDQLVSVALWWHFAAALHTFLSIIFHVWHEGVRSSQTFTAYNKVLGLWFWLNCPCMLLQRVLQSFEISNQDRAISFCWLRKGYQSLYLFQTLGTDFTAINSFLKIKKQNKKTPNYLKL